MAGASLQSYRLANLGKNCIAIFRSPALSSLSLRGVHNSAYDKNPEEHFQSTVVFDDVNPLKPEQYWGPDPRTGVFGPASDHSFGSGGDHRGYHASASQESVLEQKTFFRPMEDLDKPDQS